ncbi:MAG: hypothetical protein R6V27_16140 [Balneolaceae bacterium]
MPALARFSLSLILLTGGELVSFAHLAMMTKPAILISPVEALTVPGHSVN